eukprot:6183476-Pleurochrysis_carterae.AAC.2
MERQRARALFLRPVSSVAKKTERLAGVARERLAGGNAARVKSSFRDGGLTKQRKEAQAPTIRFTS